QIIRASFDITTGKTEFYQVKIVVDKNQVRIIEDEEEYKEAGGEKPSSTPITADKEDAEDERIRYNPEHHMFLEDAVKIKKDAKVDDELVFPLEAKDDYGRIAAQTAKQVIIQKIREAEKVSMLEEFGKRQGDIINGTVQRIERGNIFVDCGRATGLLSYDEQIPGERYRQGERIRAYLYAIDESQRGIFLRLSRSHPKFLEKLFEMEAPELTNGTVEIKVVAREAGSRSKIAVVSHDEHIDPVGSLVGQRGVRVSTVMSELSGEKIDVIEWSEDSAQFIEEALSPAKVIGITIDESENKASVEVSEDQQSLAIGKGGQNVRLAAKLTGWKIDIQSLKGENIAEADGESIDVAEDKNKETSTPSDATVNKKEIAEEEALDIAKADTNKKKEVKEDDTLADEKK
ncbi:transcription termination/antitermination protein NusA, partial [Patescibacteria group bacterium]|nr:transcription termination/antitermination protein NusA [Patescibacteria group bacterium]